MQRGGRKNAPIYTIVAADSRMPRDGRFLEKLGQYNPYSSKAEELKGIKVSAIKAWIDKGATISDSVRTLLRRNNIKDSN